MHFDHPSYHVVVFVNGFWGCRCRHTSLTTMWRALVRMREGLRRCSYRCPCVVVLCQLWNTRWLHTPEPDASACLLCLSFCLVSFASHPVPLSLCTIVVNRSSL